MRRCTFVALLIACVSPAFAQAVDPVFVRDAVGVQSHRPAPRIAEHAAAQPILMLSAAAEAAADELEAIRTWNREQRLPARNGLTRRLPSPIAVSVGSERGVVAQAERGAAWSGAVRVAGAYRFRLHLKNVTVPAGTTFWVYGRGETPIAFGRELIDAAGELYTPSVTGELAYLEIELPSAGSEASFLIADILEIVAPPATMDSPTCLLDATCVAPSTLDVISGFRNAVAYLEYVKDGGGYVCTGSLLNDDVTASSIPYLLTANHCFSVQSSANSLEAFWDYKTTSCGGSFPAPSPSLRSNGGTLLATSANSDFTFVRLNSVPAGRFYLGWDANTVANNTVLYRVSHPYPDLFVRPAPQMYSTSRLSTTVSTCPTRPRPQFLYSTALVGGVYGGSSGSPAITTGGYLVGQLMGYCGPDPSSGCDSRNYTVDGAFATTFPSVRQYLYTQTSSSPCVADAKTACVLNGRFKLTVRYRSAFDNATADSDAQVKAVTGFASTTFETVFFYFNNANNIELMVKMLDQGNTDAGGHPTIALLYGTATPLRLELTVTDTTTGAVRQYTSNFPTMVGATDFTAFVK